MPLVDWFTIVAQIINFLILVAALKYLLYDRIIGAMDQREQKIAARLEEAEKKESRADRLIDEYEQKRNELESKRDQMMDEAREEADEKRRKLMEEAKAQVEQTRKEWAQSLEKEKDAFAKDLQRSMNKEVFLAASSALKQIADQDLEERVIDLFLEKIRTLDQEQLSEIQEAVGDNGAPVLIKTAFEMDDERKGKITEELKDLIGHDGAIEFEKDQGLICGVTLKVKGRKLEWNFESFTESMEERVMELINSKSVEVGAPQENHEQR